MARRKISDNRKEEIEYRLLELIRHARAYGPVEIRHRHLIIRDLATLWGVEMPACVVDPNDKERFLVSNPGSKSNKNKIEETETPEVVPEPEQKDLTPKLEGGILAEMGYGDEDGDEKA